MGFRKMFLLAAAILGGWPGRVEAVIFLDTGDPQHNTTTPGDNSGWQYEGTFNGFLGVPIAPFFFITAKHIGGGVGNVLDFHGDLYTVIASHPSPTTDLQIWEVDHSKPFPTYAPLASGGEFGTVTLIGRGTQRGAEVVAGPEAKGWKQGTFDSVQRWGRNSLSISGDAGVGVGEVLGCHFNRPGMTDECHLSEGDSGGGMFVLQNGLWTLAGINYAVDGPFRLNSTEGDGYRAALYDAGGMEYWNGSVWTLNPEQVADDPSAFYCSRISASQAWITGITGLAAGTLAAENYAAWQTLYFTPGQIATPAQTAPAVDFDGDGIGNLLEFALNLDPTFNERAGMEPDTGLHGLPLARLETISGVERMTLEFVRRTAGSGAGLVYTGQFSSDLADWGTVGIESVVTINERWERVKVVDPVATSTAVKRFARVRVVLAE